MAMKGNGPMSTLEFYRSRADQCAREADEAKLDNVRDRCLRAQAAWEEMATRAERGQTMRDKLARDKAEAED